MPFNPEAGALPAAGEKRSKTDPRGFFTEEQIETCLLELAVCSGRPRAAKERLAEAHGISIAEKTLAGWRDRIHAHRYQRICEEQEPKIKAAVIAKAEEVVAFAGELEMKALARLDRELEDESIPARDLAGALRNITTTKTLNQDKIASPLRGRPRQIVEHRSSGEILRRLAEIGVVDGTAEELKELPEADSASG